MADDHPPSYTENGKISMNPRLIAPGTKKSVTMRSSRRKRIGSGGTISWRLRNREMIVMWFAPAYQNRGSRL